MILIRPKLTFVLVVVSIALVLGSLSPLRAQDAAAVRGFSSDGNLGTARLAHTATLLPDGRVFVAGGGDGPDLIDGFFTISQTEMFDPATANFTPVGLSPRDFHTATLLRSGQVLLAGGEIGWCSDCSPFQTPASGVTSSAEIYDPVTGHFLPTGSMSVERESHTATFLQDGRVLIVGGGNLTGLSWRVLNTAEIYDPVTGTFSTTGSLNQRRWSHTATLLADGRVLVAGGFDYNKRLSSAEIYDPVTGTFTITGSMKFSRSNHAATLLANGQVLVTGGQPDDAAGAELFDPETNSFIPAGTMLEPRVWHTSTLLRDGTVLIAGGWARGSLASAELYDPATGLFTAAGALNTSRFLHTATPLADGSVLILGGASTYERAGISGGILIKALSSAEIYRP